MGKVIKYYVSWEIEILAESPTEAVKIAKEIQQDPRSTTNFFTVEEVISKEANFKLFKQVDPTEYKSDRDTE